ncbi:MAG TPA: glycoside hydrolase family 44 protein, partial [Labilithrix sp.]|nr:glycoside hydrolase family 44 protein [Labilithrix sp.]
MRRSVPPALLRFAWAGLVMAGCSAAADVSTPGAALDAGDDVVTDASADGESERDAAGGIDGAADADAREAAAPPIVAPDTFLAGDVDVVTVIRTDMDRRPISPLIYGINGSASDHQPADVMKGVTLVRRGGDRGNSYNWETNVSNGSLNNGFTSDMQLATGIPDPNAPAGQDLAALAKNRAAGRATMVPFVLNDFVSGPVAGNIPWDQAGFDRALYFVKVELVKPTPFAATPDLGDGVVYTDEHLAYMKSKVAGDVTAPGPGRLIVGIDNEPDLYHLNFPMLQAGAGEPILAPNGRQVGTRVTGSEFTQRFIRFTKRVRSIAPSALIVGPSHYHFDGFTTWHLATSPVWNDNGRWYMDDFLADVKAASAVAGTRLLDTWDFHWYPQPLFNGTYAWNLDDAARTMSPAEIDAVLQGPRSYWDPTYDEGS